MVVFENGSTHIAKVRASATRVKVGRKRCAVAAGTPLAALVRSKPATLRFADYGSCGRRAGDSGGLYVRGIGRDVVTGPEDPNGWVYKVGNKAAPAGAADPAGPFGRGKLRSRQRVTWFWCVSETGTEGCQRTLDLKLTQNSDGTLTARVFGYDNSGKGAPVAAAVFDDDAMVGRTDETGSGLVALPPGKHTVYADDDGGLVRSHPVEVTVR
jgi:hypothetical protein